jgi:DNA-binding NtrC family response regulator
VSGSGNTTVPGPAEDFTRSRALPPLVEALVLVWCGPQPARVGEVAILDFARNPALLVARGPVGAPPDPRLLQFAPMRPGMPAHPSPLAGAGIAREQLWLRRAGAGVQVENVGTPAFFINGNLIPARAPQVLRLGDVLHVASHSSFLFTMVPASLPALPGMEAHFAFGEPDAAGFVGESVAAWDLRAQIAAAVRIGGHVLVVGETGSGKELTARELHRRSGRRGRFVAINGATLVATLAESLLFGNAGNYPNVGMRESAGFFGEADGGTLFIDEFGQLPMEVQAKLLRAMQSDGEYTRLGETRARTAAVKVVAAMNQATAVVRVDLLPRFAYRIDMPPLAARMQDVPLIARRIVLAMREKNPPLAEKFVTTEDGPPHVRMTAAFVVALLRSTYAGGVRELENVLGRAMVESEGDTLEQPMDMHPWRRPTLPPPAAPSPDDTEPNAVAEVQELLDGIRGHDDAAVLAALERRGGNQTKAAGDLGMSRDQLKRRLAKMKKREP